MRQYATSDELANYTNEPAPANADQLLQRASRLVDVLLFGVVYTTDNDGMPTDPSVVDALATATCAQASSMPTDDEDTTRWDSVKIGSVSLTGRHATSGVEVDGVPIATDTIAVLRAAGLASPTVLRG